MPDTYQLPSGFHCSLGTIMLDTVRIWSAISGVALLGAAMRLEAQAGPSSTPSASSPTSAEASSAPLAFAPPPASITGPVVNQSSLQVNEALERVNIRRARASEKITIMTEQPPVDSIRAIAQAEAQKWLRELATKQIRGIQVDPYGTLYMAAGDAAEAKAKFDERLATPGLTREERGYTYLNIIRAYAGAEKPALLPSVEPYVASLTALGPSYAYWQHEAHRLLIEAYYGAGMLERVAQHGMAAAELVSRIDYVDRGPVFSPKQGGGIYSDVVEALAARPNGRAQIDAYNALLAKGAKAPPEVLALDKDFTYMEMGYVDGLKQLTSHSDMVGKQASNIIANYWLNMPSSDSQMVSVTDGKVRVFDVSNYTCPSCLATLRQLQRLQDDMPQVQVIGTAWTIGFWGNKLVESDVEAQHLREVYVDRLKVRIPIAIWKGTKGRNADDGITPLDAGGPNLKNYPIVGVSSSFVIDGKGIIRRVYASIGPSEIPGLKKLLTQLLTEAHHGVAPASGT